MSFDLTFYTQKFTKEKIEQIVSKLQSPNLKKLEIGKNWFNFDKDGDSFKIDGQEIYVETSVLDFDPVEYFADEENYEQELSNGEPFTPILSKCDLEITFCCHDGTDAAVVCLFLTLLTFVYPESVLMDMQTGENYAGENIITRFEAIQEEFEDEE